MKKLNEPQKKWALAACLATVLSFNLVMGLAGSNNGVADFASKKKVSDEELLDVEETELDEVDAEDIEPRFESIITEKGRLKIKYVQEEDGSTTAIVPKKLESGFCWDKCGKKYLLPKNFTSSKADLELALRKAMVKEVIQKSKEEDVEQEDVSDEELDEVVTKKAKKLKKKVEEEQDEEETVEIEEKEDKEMIALNKKCDRKEDDARMSCFANGLKAMLSNGKKEHAREDVLRMYKREVEPGLIEALSDMRDSDRREEGQTILEDMLASISKKHNYLRERVVKLSALAVIKANQDAQKSFQRAESLKSTNPQQAMRWQVDGFNRRSMAEQMASNLDYTLQSGLESAYYNKMISENKAVDLYSTQFSDVVQPIIQGMRMNPHTYVIASGPLSESGLMMDSNGNLVSSDSLGPIGQMRSIGRGIYVINNGLTSSNVIGSSTPTILATGVNVGQGTATIQAIPASAIPTSFMSTGAALPVGGQPIAAPGTNVISIRGN
ncbi:hypothetical protein [Bdellovibrio sp. HCB337]|uniref:hypothetical protein n=1 Tax=Bdellovibrio sp. HCB337 TaxID=3394358 RepID=UPI0039A74B3F